MASLAVKQIFVVFISLNLMLSVMIVTEDIHENNFCPDRINHGDWNQDGDRCILKCHSGYSAHGCNVIRKDSKGGWNHDVPTCEEDSFRSKESLACILALGAAVIASPYLLSQLGFSAGGIVAGSLAAKYMAWMGMVPKGGWFAYFQSMGMKGGFSFSKETIALIQQSVGGACKAITSFSFQHGCEKE